jgi:hypothetical protein
MRLNECPARGSPRVTKWGLQFASQAAENRGVQPQTIDFTTLVKEHQTRGQALLGICRVLLCLVVLAGFVVVQASVVVDDYLHDHGGNDHHACPLCQSGHIQILPALHVVEVALIGITGWHYLPGDSQPHSVLARSFHPSRAPPV